MQAPVRKPACYEDILSLPDNLVGEIIDGGLIASPRPASRHAKAASVLQGELYGTFQKGSGGPGRWWFLSEPELHLGADILVPDTSGWRWERMPQLPDVAFFTLAPDWVCEILSPGTAKLDLVLKLPRYAAAGVGHAWVVDSEHRVVEVFRRQGNSWVLTSAFADDAVMCAEPFETFNLELSALWLEKPQP